MKYHGRIAFAGSNQMLYRTSMGTSSPLGATVRDDGVNFSIYSREARSIELQFFDHEDDQEPSQVFKLKPRENKTFYYWHIFVKGARAGQLYGWRAGGVYDPDQGLFFDESKLLIDPYAKDVVGFANYSRSDASVFGKENSSLKAVVVDRFAYDWEDDRGPRIPFSHTVIYEMHVAGFTKSESSGLSASVRGSYRGIVEKIPYLKELGVTTLELMPVQQFDHQDGPPGLSNYWGYSPISFFSPHKQYASDQGNSVDEFRDMVKALHANGMEVILDVVFNHTAENDRFGPTLSLRGLDNRSYYILDQATNAYQDFTGCGNTLKAEHPVVVSSSFSIRYAGGCEICMWMAFVSTWLRCCRAMYGAPRSAADFVCHRVGSVLAGTSSSPKPGTWQDSIRGWFVNQGDWYAEWNGPFRDDVRKFVRGDEKMVHALMARILGSADIYRKTRRDPNRSIHYVTCHDGFTLNDLVSYNHKHNEANGHENRDGNDQTYSWNCGVEGETDDAKVERLRLRQMKNLLTILFMSQGTPMLSMGDEMRRSLEGNNNAYCQDNELNWLDWSKESDNGGMLEFTRKIIRFTQSLGVFDLDHDLLETVNAREPYIQWHGVRLHEPDTSDWSHSIAFELRDVLKKEHLYVAFNAYWRPLGFQLPAPTEGSRWRRIIDTYRQFPEDFCELHEAPYVKADVYRLQERSSLVLISGPQL
ncbi:MAG: glycogen-debranching protein [Cyanobacteriota/Melainabacteria group bacterium]